MAFGSTGGTEVGKIFYSLDLDDDQFKKGLSSAKGGIGDFTKSAVQGSEMVAAGVAAAAAAAVAFGVSSVKAFEESQNLIAQTGAVLKSTGGVAGVTADQVTKLSAALQSTTKYSDEEVRSAENLLLTFTSIGKDIFPQATKTVLNMATALGEDTKSASIQLGKALQDPILGVTALRRVGVNFNDAQKTVIENLVNTGHAAEAQQIIMKELEKEFGGSAEAAGKTFAGQLAKLKNTFNDLQEQVGQTIVKALSPFADALGRWIAKVQDAGGLMKYLSQTVEAHRGQVYALVGVIIGALIPAFVALGTTIWTALAPLLPFAAAGAAVALVVAVIAKHFGGLGGLVNAVKREFEAIGDVLDRYLGPIIRDMVDQWQNNLLPALRKFWDAYGPEIKTMVKDIAIVIGVVLVAAIASILAWWDLLIRAVSDVINIYTKLKDKFDEVIGYVGKKMQPFVQDTIKGYQTISDEVKPILSRIADDTKAGFDIVVSKAKTALQTMKDDTVTGFNVARASITTFVDDTRTQLEQWGDNINKKNHEFHTDFLGTTQSALDGAKNALLGYVTGEIDKWSGYFDTVSQKFTDWASGIPGRIETGFNNTKTAVENWFTNTGESIANGLTNFGTNFEQWFNDLPGKVTAWFDNTKTAIRNWFVGLADSLKPDTDNATSKVAQNVGDGVKNGLSTPDKIRQIGDTLMMVIGLAILAVAFYFVDAGSRLASWIISGIWSGIKGAVGAVSSGISGAVSAVWGFYGQFVDAGWGLIRAFGNGIKGAADGLYNDVKGVLNRVAKLLPHSDAEEGPFSDLTLSGQRFSETFAQGILNSGDAVKNAVNQTLDVPLGGLGSGLAMPGAPNLGAGIATGNATVNHGEVTNTFYGDISIDSKETAQDFLGQLTRSDQLVDMGLSG